MDDVLTRVREVFHEVFGTSVQLISLETTPNDVPSWDSIGHLNLANTLEQVFGIWFDNGELAEMESVREIVRIINAKQQSSELMDDVLTRVREVFHEVFGTSVQLISLETTPNDVPSWDSIGHLNLANTLEQVFGIWFDNGELAEMESVGEIVRIIHAKQQSSELKNPQ